MSKVKIWTKQHEGIVKILNEHGRYVVKREYIEQKMEEHAGLYLDVYTWYAGRAEKIAPRPPDASFPIWVSLSAEEKIENSDGNVLIEAMVEESALLTIDIDKWGYIVNYLYIPRDERDREEHEKMLAKYRIDDCGAYMSPFYPNIKQKIIKSWDLLFDESVVMSPVRVGTIWELREEWIVKITK